MDQFPIPEDCTIDTYKELREKRVKAVVELAGVDYTKYHSEYLSIKRSGCGAVLQRDIGEIWTNAFNKDWLRAWNGNMDLQVCLDFFAVISYIVDYAYKPEPEESALRQLIEQDKDGDFKTRMKSLAHLFQTRRQMGEAEAAYKIIPSLTMTRSNITCQWVNTDHSKDTHKRMRRAKPEDQIATVELEGREGKWYQQYDIRNKYTRRPEELHHLCLAQFSKMYVSSSASKSENTDDEDEQGDTEVVTAPTEHCPLTTVARCSNSCCEETSAKKRIIKLPETIKLKDPFPGEARFMRLRRSPVALRFYKGNRDKSAARHFRREFILYYPWGLPGQPNFATMSDTEIENHFSNEDLEHIAEVKGLIMPHLEDVEKQRIIIEETQVRKLGEQLAAEKEHENLEDLDFDEVEEGDLDFLDPNLEEPVELPKGKPSIYSKIEVRK